MRVGEAVIRQLEARGVEVIFGIPGVHTVELYRGLADSPIRAVTARSEAGAGFMADAYARVTGKPGVCILISGPGYDLQPSHAVAVEVEMLERYVTSFQLIGRVLSTDPRLKDRDSLTGECGLSLREENHSPEVVSQAKLSRSACM